MQHIKTISDLLKNKKEEVMSKRNIHKLMALLIIAVFAIAYPQMAQALGTQSGTSISNTATVNYNVGGVGQAPINSVAATFLVDRKVIFTVTKTDAAPVQVAPGSTAQVLHFRVDNTGNGTEDFSLAAADLASTGTITFGVTDYTDNFNSNAGVTVCVDANTNNACDGGEVAFIDNLARDTAETRVIVVIDIPAGRASNDVAGILVTATARLASGNAGAPAAVEAESASDDPAVEDVVLADAAGSYADDAARDAAYTDRSAYIVSAAILSITKTATTIRDPSNLNVNPKAIPGAYLRYVITVANAAGATSSAILTTITDALNANTTIDPDLIVAATGAPENAAGDGFKVVVTGSTRALNGANQYFSTANDADGVEHNAGNVTATMTTVLPVEAGPGYAAGELKPGETVTITFNVTIN
jgi:hypothetical protein